ncbi:sugar transferase [Salinibacterium sp. UTAS2018]|uniref:sugar transferase n=1 Tax=Salinibacterium sp. UTAS2018 TaxID=2508880 RepID=UPI0010096A91|nr:sugar transferase [Salinibacterium sp. UTAS2018]QAV70549.1 sugar transferase [Salinibacterium sp. UTAS2018]
MMSQRYLLIRAASDRVFAAILLVLSSPVLLLIAITIRAKMGTPIMFRQTRVGRFGKKFEIVKFRTMIVGAEVKGGGYMPPELNLVPPLGQFLRTTSLDELPQLLNIFAGDMAFVGPRPALVEQYERYSAAQKRRLEVPQGVTGLAQVRFRNSAPWSKRIEADVEYVQSVSPGLDIRILLKTVGRVMRAEGVLLNQTRQDVDDLSSSPKTEEKNE